MATSSIVMILNKNKATKTNKQNKKSKIKKKNKKKKKKSTRPTQLLKRKKKIVMNKMREVIKMIEIEKNQLLSWSLLVQAVARIYLQVLIKAAQFHHPQVSRINKEINFCHHMLREKV